MTVEELVMRLALSASLSLGRMFAAYVISLLLALITGVAMARNKYVETVLLPILDVLQSIPILGFFPAVLLVFVSLLGPAAGSELSSIFLIVTSLVWNMIFGVYSSVKSLDPSIDHLTKVYRLSSIHRFLYVYVPASRSSVAANSIVSWAGGWFFLTSAEVISLGKAEYRLNGLGSFIIEAFEEGDTSAYTTGLLALSAVILVSYLVIWNPLAMKYADARTLLGFVRTYNYIERAVSRAWGFMVEKLLVVYNLVRRGMGFLVPLSITFLWGFLRPHYTGLFWVDSVVLGKVMEYGFKFLLEVPNTFVRVYSVVVAGLAVSVLLAYASHRRLKLGRLIVVSGEILSSIPAMMWWPILLPLLRGSPWVVMMFIYLQGSLWYAFFNILIFGLSSLKESILELSRVYNIRGRLYMLRIFVPSLLPSILAGGLSASGGAWNSSVAAEYIAFENLVVDMGGLGSLLNRQAQAGDVLGVLSTSIFMSLVVVAVNKLVWARALRRIGGYLAVE